MANNFDAFFARVLKDEGDKYEDVAGDNGGPTRCGVTIFDVARYNGIKIPDNIAAVRKCAAYPKLVEMVKGLTPEKAKPVYKRFYWDDVRADELPHGLDYAVADYATNSGEAKAAATLGALVGVPGRKVTDAMIAAVDQYPSLSELITHFQDARRSFLMAISDASNPRYLHNVKFRDGWLNRESRVRRIALAMAAEMPPAQTPPRTLARAVEIAEAAPPATFSEAQKPNALMTASTSPTIWSLVVAFFTGIWNGFEKIIDTVIGLFGSAGDIQADADAAAAPLQSILGMLKVDAAYIGTGIAVACLVVAIIRHIDAKRGTS